ncbi:hypothetical protein ELI_0172 [Eubacterium callanderi]|uniref:Uncharacterized protein n=1 Tax=Eubacterium callanderi TaxID=53442 RepID=E3GHN9_9FIRM|nr:hypothetical protein ELI_0172 [Eubacterium callanderi]
MFCQALFKIYFLNFSSAGLKALRCCTLRDSLLSIPRTLPFVKRFLTFILIFFDFILTWIFKKTDARRHLLFSTLYRVSVDYNLLR